MHTLFTVMFYCARHFSEHVLSPDVSERIEEFIETGHRPLPHGLQEMLQLLGGSGQLQK